MTSSSGDGTGEVVVVERQVPGGDGMGRLADGRPVFVQGAFRGDVVRLGQIVDKRSFVRANSHDLVEASPDRTTPLCPVVHDCGGCDFMGLHYSAQLREKASLIEQALVRTGGFPAARWASKVRVREAPAEFGYRSRVRLQIADGRVGFFKKGTHLLVEVPDCKVASPTLLESMQLVRDVVAASPTAFGQVESVEVRALVEGETQALHSSTCSAHFAFARGADEKKATDQLREPLEALADHLTVRIGSEAAEEQCYQPDAHVRVRSAPGGFTQVNLAVNRLLVERVMTLVDGARTFIDLFCGSGNFALPLAHRGLTGVGVEANPEAIDSARRAAHEMGLPDDGVEFVAAPCDSYVRTLARRRARFDVALLDPPRAGAKDVIPALAALGCPTVLYVSCDPVTLARDLRLLVSEGYTLTGVEGFDMFPQTHHVETLAILELSESPRLSAGAT